MYVSRCMFVIPFSFSEVIAAYLELVDRFAKENDGFRPQGIVYKPT